MGGIDVVGKERTIFGTGGLRNGVYIDRIYVSLVPWTYYAVPLRARLAASSSESAIYRQRRVLSK